MKLSTLFEAYVDAGATIDSMNWVRDVSPEDVTVDFMARLQRHRRLFHRLQETIKRRIADFEAVKQ